MKHYISKSAVCPFYQQEERQKVRCEGFEKGTSMHLVFTSLEGKDKHKRECCCNEAGYKKCPIYVIVARQYEEV